MIFISHKTDPDHAIALEVYNKLTGNGIQCWIAPESLKHGESFAKEIPNVINTCKMVVLILSEHTSESEDVLTELEFARRYRKKIIPLKIGDLELDDYFENPALEYCLSNSQIQPFHSTEEEYAELIEQCKLGERLVEMELSKKPKRTLNIISGDFQDNLDYMIRERPNEFKKTVFAVGIDASSRLEISSTKGILKWVIKYLSEEWNVTIDELQCLVNQAKKEQLHHETTDMSMHFKDSVLIKVPLLKPGTAKEPLILKLLLIANSQKKGGPEHNQDVDDVEGIDSREIIIEVFNKCVELGDEASSLFIGAMGTNGLSFPYEVVTSEILNCFAYAQRQKTVPFHLYYSIRKSDMAAAGLTIDEILSYISMTVRFYRK